jgi:hypothetical protein
VKAEDIELALAEVAEIKAARVVASPDGVIQEVHVLASPSKAPKQLVRDIESTIMARFGIPIDHKKISIAQLGHDAVAKNGSAPPSMRPRIVSISSSVAGVHTTVAVTLEIGGTDYVGKASGPNSQTGRQRLVASATLDAISQSGDNVHIFALEDVSVLPLGKERVAVACVTLVSTFGEQSYAGSALVRQNEKDSIVRATLDAINRRMGFLTS